MSNTGGPPSYVSDAIGNADDAIILELNGEQVLYAQGYTVEESILAQPARWSVSIGSEAGALDLFAAAPPGSIFTLSIGDTLQASGYTDARQLTMTGSGSMLTVHGRDALAPLHDGEITAQHSFNPNATTYSSMVQYALSAVGLDPSKLVLTNENNRRLKAGVPIQQLAQPTQQNAIAPPPTGSTLGAYSLDLQAKFGERWLEFLRHHLDRAGLMLWAAADGSFVLTTPNPQQTPSYTLYRQIDVDNVQTNILGWDLLDDTTQRHSEYVFQGRGGGRKKGRVKAKGEYIDAEMADYGIHKPFAARDSYVQTNLQAAYAARRKSAEERRAGWKLEYTFAGHTLPQYGSGTDRAIVTTDTTIEVADDLLGQCGTFYIETVKRERGPNGTQTTIRLMRPDDLVFGEISAPATTGAVKPADVPKPAGLPHQTFNYLAEGHPPMGAVGQDATGQFVDANGNPIPQ